MAKYSVKSENRGETLTDKFLQGLKRREVISSDFTGNIVNFDWFDFVNEIIPYIDNIYNNAKTFLKDEEEILQVEKVKKTSPATIKHLSKHSDFVRDYDEEKNKVIPEKLLNSYKEDTHNTYENRFVVTLTDECGIFLEDLEKRLNKFEEENINSFVYNGKTSFEGEDVSINFLLKSTNMRSSSVKEFLEKSALFKNSISSWRETALYKILKQERAPAVTDPIKRTNVILKNPNFQQAVRLWDFIHNFTFDMHPVTHKKDFYSELLPTFEERVNSSFLIFYYIMMYTSSKDLYTRNIYEAEIKKLINKDFKDNIESLLLDNEEMTKEQLIEIVSSEYDVIKKEKVADASIIANKINASTKQYLSDINSSFFQIGGEGEGLKPDFKKKERLVIGSRKERNVDELDNEIDEDEFDLDDDEEGDDDEEVI